LITGNEDCDNLFNAKTGKGEPFGSPFCQLISPLVFFVIFLDFLFDHVFVMLVTYLFRVHYSNRKGINEK
tara:strand:- start:642 stop:851 length:210 start_codon:yes stop_codon:yes gene_type:complete